VRVGSNVGDIIGRVGVMPFGVGVGGEAVELAQDVNIMKQKSKAVEITLTRLTNIEYPS
jgi:hypothetical protein